MNNLQNITDVTLETFPTQVLERSRQVPVLVDYWADWCGPCQMQMPVLKKLVEDYAGKFVLAKVNTDQQRELAVQHNIRSLPTMRLYRNGDMAEEILGAQTESTLRILLDRYVERESDQLRNQARALFEQGERAQALELLATTHAQEPDNHQVTLDYAQLCLGTGSTQLAEQLLGELPFDVRNEAEALRLRALLDFTQAAGATEDLADLEHAVATTPDDSALRYRLGAACVLSDRLDAALEHFLYLLQHDRTFQDDAGRKAMLAVFDLLGNEGELVSRYRRKMSTALL
ncbi:MAG TPA: tetratricopeptide repeat protein [Gammaproteobacteria bacterium]|nr:tetratricopeptide repeat protein [Gammaproteobacteria bacterium]